MADEDPKKNEGTTTETGSGDNGGQEPNSEEGWKRLQGMIDESTKAAVAEGLKNWQPPAQTPAAGQGPGKAPAAPAAQKTRSQGMPKIGSIERMLFGQQPPLRQSRQESRSQGNKGQ